MESNTRGITEQVMATEQLKPRTECITEGPYKFGKHYKEQQKFD